MSRREIIATVVLFGAGCFLVGLGVGKASPLASCHFRAGGALPDRRCTPGALNPSVTQGDIRVTICRVGWTSIVRPPSYITAPEKIDSMVAYGIGGRDTADYEYDHLIPLELGGAVNDTRNLWPERRYLGAAGAYKKDAVENALHAQVCAGTRTLRSAQRAIAHDWRHTL